MHQRTVNLFFTLFRAALKACSVTTSLTDAGCSAKVAERDSSPDASAAVRATAASDDSLDKEAWSTVVKY
jgi:hypothetical protein